MVFTTLFRGSEGAWGAVRRGKRWGRAGRGGRGGEGRGYVGVRRCPGGTHRAAGGGGTRQQFAAPGAAQFQQCQGEVQGPGGGQHWGGAERSEKIQKTIRAPQNTAPLPNPTEAPP